MPTETNTYLPNFIYDTEMVEDLDVNSPEFTNFLVTLTQTMNDLIDSANSKEIGIHSRTEALSGKIFFSSQQQIEDGQQPLTRNSFRTTIDFGALPNASLKTVPHNIEGIGETYALTQLYGGATDISSAPTITMIPIPYIDVIPSSNIQIYADETNIYIDTDTIDRTSFTKCIVVMEYIKF